MLRVSLNGKEPQAVDFVVLYDKDIPIAVAANHGSVVYYVDSLRDRDEFIVLLKNLGVPIPKLHQFAGTL